MKIFSSLSLFAVLGTNREPHWSPRLKLRLRNIGRWPLSVRIVAWGAAFVLGAALGSILLLPSWRALTIAEQENRLLSEKLEQQQRNLTPLRNRAAQQDTMRAQYKTWLNTLPREASTAALLQALDKAARERGAALRQLKPGQVKSGPEHIALPLAAELEGEYVALAGFVHSLALLPWPVTVEKLSMAPVPGIPGQLRLQLELHYRQLRQETRDEP